MKDVNGKREIEAVCETWEGGLVGYLVWKIKRVLLQMEEGRGYDFIDSQENTLDITEIMDTDGIYDI